LQAQRSLLLTRWSVLRQLFVLFFFGSGLAFILFPDLTMRLAHLVAAVVPI